eukprot:748465-Prorocentrum_lima.AAC.1
MLQQAKVWTSQTNPNVHVRRDHSDAPGYQSGKPSGCNPALPSQRTGKLNFKWRDMASTRNSHPSRSAASPRP